MSEHDFTSIATIYSCYKEKFGIPRQPGLVANQATIEIDAAYSEDEAFRELESFSHIWVIFVFHQINNRTWKPTVRPPRLGGNKRVGVFATRSMFRPNPIGLSVVELNGIERKGGLIKLTVTGGDFLNATPVLDIKPYLPYADAIKTVKVGYASDKPSKTIEVVFSEKAINGLEKAKVKYPDIVDIVTETLQFDPRPAYQNKKPIKNQFSIKLYDYDLKWEVENEKILVTHLVLLGL